MYRKLVKWLDIYPDWLTKVRVMAVLLVVAVGVDFVAQAKMRREGQVAGEMVEESGYGFDLSRLLPYGGEGSVSEGVAGSWSERWSVLDNRADGYRFAYPEEFEIDVSAGNKVVLTSDIHRGMILVYNQDGGIVVKEVVDGLSQEEQAVIAEAAAMIRGTAEKFMPEEVVPIDQN